MFELLFLLSCWGKSSVLALEMGPKIGPHIKARKEPEDHWSCIAHLSAEDMLKSAVIEEKKFKHSPWAGAGNPLRPKFLCQQEGLITMIICCKFKKNLFNLTLYTSFHDLTNVYSCRSWADNPRGHTLMSTETSCPFGHLLQVSKNLSEVWFYTIFFMILYMYIAPRQGLTTSWGWNFYVNRNIL